MSSIDDSEYASSSTSKDEDLIIHDFAVNFGTFNYMPSNFLGVKTNELGFHISDREQSPFIQLTNKLLEEASTLSVEDRMQGARYLCTVPYQNGTYHCTQVAWGIVKDPSIDIYKRYYFLSNREQYFALNDHVIQCLHPLFLNYFMKKLPSEFAAVVIPNELLLMTIQYIFTHFGGETTVRQDALDWCLDCINNEHESMHIKLKVMDLFIEYGHDDEKAFALQMLEDDFGIEKTSDYKLNPGLAAASNILRSLRTKYAGHYLQTSVGVKPEDIAATFAPAKLFMSCAKYINITMSNDGEKQQYNESLEWYFNEIVDGSGSFEGISMKQLCYLLHLEIQDISINKDKSFETAILRRIVDQIHQSFQSCVQNDECISNHSEYAIDLLNTLEDFTQPRTFELGPSLTERLRNEIFGALNQTLFHLESGEYSIIQKARASSDKSAIKEFLVLYFDDEREIIRDKFKHVSDAEFNSIYDQVVLDWSN